MSTPMRTFSTLLRSASLDRQQLDEAGLKRIATDIETALRLVNKPDISSAYADDITAMIVGLADIVSLVTSANYPVHTVLDLVNKQRTLLHRLEQYTRSAQQTYRGYCVVNNATGVMLPSLFFSPTEAKSNLESIAAVFKLPVRDFAVVEVSYGSTTVGVPLSGPSPALPPEVPPPIPVSEVATPDNLPHPDNIPTAIKSNTPPKESI